jgi:PAS domain S-box-containing protein
MNNLSDILPHFPVSIVLMNEKMEIVGATREAYLLFDAYLHSRSPDQSIKELSEKLFCEQALLSFIGGAILSLKRPGSSSTYSWTTEHRAMNVTAFVLPWKDNALHYGIYFENITERLELEKTKDNLRVYLESVLDSLPEGIIAMDRSMNVTSINAEQMTILHRTDSTADVLQVVGTPVQELFTYECNPSWEDVRTHVLLENVALHGEERQISGDGSDLIYNITVAPLTDYAGTVVGIVRITKDITALERLRNEIKKGELMAARLQLVGQVAITLNQEINTALTGIVAFSQLMHDRGTPSPEDKDHLILIQQEAERIRKFVRDFTQLKEIGTETYLENEDEQMLHVPHGDS